MSIPQVKPYPKNFTVDNLTVKETITLSDFSITVDQFLLPDGSTAVPSLSFASAPTMGFFKAVTSIIGTLNALSFPASGSIGFAINDTDLSVRDTKIYRDAAGVLVLKNEDSPQTFKIYETYTDASNYERYALIASGNQLEIKAETAGTGADDLDILLTPAGTGNVKFGAYTAGAATDSTGYITIKDAAGNLRKLMVQA